MFQRMFIIAAAVAVPSGTAFAADLPTTKGPPVFKAPPPAFTWTGFYVGGQAGYQWGHADALILGPAGGFLAGLPDNPSGFIGGAHLGYNYQLDQIVLGIEGDIEGSTFAGPLTGPLAPGPAGPAGSPLPVPPFNHLANRIPLQASLRGRIGYAWDRALLYATGGLALADVENAYGSPGDVFWGWRPGWTAGGGGEYAIDNNWSVRIEYRYSDFGHYYLGLVNTFPGDIARVRLYDSAVRAGFSYKFNTW